MSGAGKGVFAVGLAVMLSGCAVSGVTGLTTRQKNEAHRVENALNRPVRLEGRFVQTGTATGNGAGHFVYQPGMLHLDYVLPHAMTLRASGTHLILNDFQTGAVTRVSLARHPLGLMLHVPVRFAGRIQVTDASKAGGVTKVSLVEADNPSQGLLRLQFLDTSGSLHLAALDGVDARRNRVTLKFYDVTESSTSTGVAPKN